VLHHARGCATGFVAPAIAVSPAPTFALGWPRRVLPAARTASFARGPVGYAEKDLVGSRRSSAQRPLRGKCSAALRIQHNSLLCKVGPVATQASLGDPTAARPAGSHKRSYVLRPYTANSVIWRFAWVHSALRDRWSTPNLGAALARLLARSLRPAPAAVSW
jgi:hypothetical protein